MAAVSPGVIEEAMNAVVDFLLFTQLWTEAASSWAMPVISDCVSSCTSPWVSKWMNTPTAPTSTMTSTNTRLNFAA